MLLQLPEIRDRNSIVIFARASPSVPASHHRFRPRNAKSRTLSNFPASCHARRMKIGAQLSRRMMVAMDSFAAGIEALLVLRGGPVQSTRGAFAAEDARQALIVMD